MKTETNDKSVAARISSQFEVILQKTGLPELQTKVDKIVYNEDNVEEIGRFLEKLKEVEDGVKNVFKDGKAPHWEMCKLWDNTKNIFLERVLAVRKKVQPRYNVLCLEIQEKERKAEQERERVERIKNGIEANVINFARRIGETLTLEELLNVERAINLEKGRKEKYGEFFDLANERFDTLREHIAGQKQKLRELEKVREEREKAIQEEDAGKIDEVDDKIAELENIISENKVDVQNAAVDMISTRSEVIVPEMVYPTVKAKRTTWKYELVDSDKAVKEKPELLDITLNNDAAKGFLKGLKDRGALEGKTEVIVSGIRFYEHQTF